MARRLIEEWLPVAELGIEALRERTPMTPFPAPNRLHVWWARRPLVAARAAVLASLLPADADHEKFLQMLGIHGDPVAARKAMAKVTGKDDRIANPYGYSRAFSYSPNCEELRWFRKEMRRGGIELPASCLDPTAGGGSIPFESLRLRLNTYANDLNPVAALVERLTLEVPYYIGDSALAAYQSLAREWRERMEERLTAFFPQPGAPDQLDTTYLFARTIRCPHCGGLIPLSPNWRLAPDGTGVKILPRSTRNGRICEFAIVHTAAEQSPGTIAKGAATCPWPDCGRTVTGPEIKAIARDGGMGEQLYAIVYKQKVIPVLKSGKKGKPKWIRGYRAPEARDDVFAEIQAKLAEKMPEWAAQDFVPEEPYNEMFCDRSKVYGVNYWRDLFSPRQLYCHVTSVEVFTELLAEARQKPDFGEAQKAAFGYLALALDKLLGYGSRSCRWDISTARVRSIFDRHDFAFVASYAEMAQLVAGAGYDWALAQTGKALGELIELLRPEAAPLLGSGSAAPQIVISCGPGAALAHVPDQSIDAVVMDPPYYDNVMYAELSDFFYVWLKRTAGQIWPELFRAPLTDKEAEAVANPALYGGNRKEAHAAYRDAMAAIFSEARRCLKPDGIMTVMFTHKATGAWDALARGLMEAGFAISASWPVSSEAEGSQHVRDKAAAKSSIFLVCRPRPAATSDMFWKEIAARVRRETAERAEAFASQGIGGIDLYLACYGPALSLFSQHWPVQREDGADVAPEAALREASAAVREWRLAKLAQSAGRPGFDPLLGWYLLAWDAFGAAVFAYDEALNLARVAGLDLESDIVNVLGEKKGQDFLLWDGSTRAAHCRLGNGKSPLLDAIQQACALAEKSGLAAARGYLEAEKLATTPEFQTALAAVCAVLPKSSPDGKNLAALARLLAAGPVATQGKLDFNGETA